MRILIALLLSFGFVVTHPQLSAGGSPEEKGKPQILQLRATTPAPACSLPVA